MRLVMSYTMSSDSKWKYAHTEERLCIQFEQIVHKLLRLTAELIFNV